MSFNPFNFPGSGDANQDGVVDIGDAAYIASAVVGLPGFTLNEFMDINGDGIADIGDAAYIASAVVGLPGFFLPTGQSQPLFELSNITNTSANLIFHKQSLPNNVTSIGAFEVEIRNATIDAVNVPSQFENAYSYYLTGPQRFAFANINGIVLNDIPNDLSFNLSIQNDTGINLITGKTRLWDNSENVNAITV